MTSAIKNIFLTERTLTPPLSKVVVPEKHIITC